MITSKILRVLPVLDSKQWTNPIHHSAKKPPHGLKSNNLTMKLWKFALSFVDDENDHFL
jgi:hypothetical protein